MRAVTVYVDAGDGQWCQVGKVRESQQPGSLSSYEPDGRQVYVFGWTNGEGPAVWRAIGDDVENPDVRVVFGMLFQLADLDKEPFELVRFAADGSVRNTRFEVTDA